MTRLELLTIVVGRARSHGFEFRRWYTTRLGLPWISAEAALNLLAEQRRYYALLFSHEFAEHFWKAGQDMAFSVSGTTFERILPDGTTRTITRPGFTRRSIRKDAWRYHLREMAVAEDPLRHIRKYLAVEDELEEDAKAGVAEVVKPRPPRPAPIKKTRTTPIARPVPTGTPDFLKRPYR